jgi:hypothetical protein
MTAIGITQVIGFLIAEGTLAFAGGVPEDAWEKGCG